MANKKFGSILRELRNAKGYTQQQIADMLGLKNKSTLGSWEIGKSEPDGYTLLRLCKIYNVSDIYETFNEIAPMPKQSSNPMVHEIAEKYERLDDGYQKLIESQINQLLELQKRQHEKKND